MINLNRFLSDLKDALGWPYASPGSTGKDCSHSGIDCSGMAVRAFKLQGNSSLHHGCNTMWRDGCFSDKGTLTSVSQLKPGYAVLLNRDWRDGDSGNKWYGDKDGNMTHIGYVLSVNPLQIIDASASAGEVRITSTLKKVGWNRWGRFKAIAYTDTTETKEEEVPVLMTATVQSSNGKGANLREKKTTASDLVVTVPDGEQVEVLDTSDASRWKVSYNGQTGYCLSKLLTVGVSSALTTEERLTRLEKAVFG